jgi:alpha-amylase/alpha-mannosidase (GH57 family)
MNAKIEGVVTVVYDYEEYNPVIHISLRWYDENHGFGLIDISQDRTGTFINSENMGREFVKKVLCSLVDEADIEREE